MKSSSVFACIHLFSFFQLSSEIYTMYESTVQLVWVLLHVSVKWLKNL